MDRNLGKVLAFIVLLPLATATLGPAATLLLAVLGLIFWWWILGSSGGRTVRPTSSSVHRPFRNSLRLSNPRALLRPMLVFFAFLALVVVCFVAVIGAHLGSVIFGKPFVGISLAEYWPFQRLPFVYHIPPVAGELGYVSWVSSIQNFFAIIWSAVALIAVWFLFESMIFNFSTYARLPIFDAVFRVPLLIVGLPLFLVCALVLFFPSNTTWKSGPIVGLALASFLFVFQMFWFFILAAMLPGLFRRVRRKIRTRIRGSL